MKRSFTMPTGEVITKDWPDWKTPYNHDTDFEAQRTATYCHEPSLTKQEFKEDADINNIIQRVMQTQEVPAILPEHYLDTSNKPTYYEIQQRLAEVSAQFYTLPPKLRADHLNDPARWADQVVAAASVADVDKLKELGVEIEKPEGLTAEPPSREPLQPREPPKEDPPAPPQGGPKEAPNGA